MIEEEDKHDLAEDSWKQFNWINYLSIENQWTKCGLDYFHINHLVTLQLDKIRTNFGHGCCHEDRLYIAKDKI